MRHFVDGIEPTLTTPRHAKLYGSVQAQLRRLIPLDVTAPSMPDLALMGRRAVAAARNAEPLTVPTPRGPVDEWREPVVQALRDVLTPEALKFGNALQAVFMPQGPGRMSGRTPVWSNVSISSL